MSISALDSSFVGRLFCAGPGFAPGAGSRPLFQRRAVCTPETTKEQNDNDVLWLFLCPVNAWR
ncbi:hypothetical protein CW354_20500 [Marinicaulis flavus]|uniref:Uncharacterized protein n=1 Tax=Hyphococcus luteus TaxID=2058213 RepID=A0A2S7JYM3_9PROT|nr:hypothetical protein CW354_20500 [Marinicaulis flavus]